MLSIGTLYIHDFNFYIRGMRNNALEQYILAIFTLACIRGFAMPRIIMI